MVVLSTCLFLLNFLPYELKKLNMFLPVRPRSFPKKEPQAMKSLKYSPEKIYESDTIWITGLF